MAERTKIATILGCILALGFLPSYAPASGGSMNVRDDFGMESFSNDDGPDASRATTTITTSPPTGTTPSTWR